jgi:DNA-binding beta-propeller fold protein YncE
LWIVKPASNPEESSYKSQLTTTQVYAEKGNAITAPQHGRFVIFIDSDNNLRFIGTDNTGEEVINADGDWGSIAVSPDVGKLAATTTFEDSTIFVFDLDNGTNKPIKL